MNRILLVIAFTIVMANSTYAQNCAQTLRLVRSTYDQGRLHELPSLMKECLASGFTKQERVEAYKLLTMAYIYLEEPEKADSSMLKLLNADPYFEPNKDVDPQEFIGLYRTFRTRPIFRLGVKFGMNGSQPNVSTYNPVSDGTAKYTSNIGVGGGFVGELPINDKITLTGELLYLTKSFTNSTSNTYFSNGTAVEYSSSIGSETQNWLSLPILVQYTLSSEKKIQPFLVGGVSTDLLLNAKLQGEQKRVDNQSIDVKSFSLTPQREKLNISAVLGFGAKTRIAGGYLVADLRYSYGLTKTNSLATLYDNQFLLIDYKLIDGVFSLNSLYFSVGYVQNFFNPKKLKRKK